MAVTVSTGATRASGTDATTVSARGFATLASLAAAGAAVLSVVYAVAYLVVTPSVQRKSDVGRALRSYLEHPAGHRLASTCLLVSGPLVALAWVGLTLLLERTRRDGWTVAAGLLGVVAALATAAHGLADLVGYDKLAHTFATGDAATRAAVRVSALQPAAVDPRGLFTFGVAGLAIALAACGMWATSPRLARLAAVLGVDMVVLFVATATGVNALVLVTGGLASVVLGPAWWLSVAGRLRNAYAPEAA
jgi:hypothetical protein